MNRHVNTNNKIYADTTYFLQNYETSDKFDYETTSKDEIESTAMVTSNTQTLNKKASSPPKLIEIKKEKSENENSTKSTKKKKRKID